MSKNKSNRIKDIDEENYKALDDYKNEEIITCHILVLNSWYSKHSTFSQIDLWTLKPTCLWKLYGIIQELNSN